jgi:tRNA (mo5U34)-methyltransferase
MTDLFSRDANPVPALFSHFMPGKVFDYSALLSSRRPTELRPWIEMLPDQLAAELNAKRHGDWDSWRRLLTRLPKLEAPFSTSFDTDIVSVAADQPIGASQRCEIEELLRQLHPWRKGPYNIHGVHIDTEWRSDMKWRRLCGAIQPLAGKTVLDVGCGNGYHAWRMLGAGAGLVVGIDPTLLSVVQFHAMKHFMGPQWPVHVLPLGIEQVPAGLAAFDTVFSMGILYHRRSPLDHLMELRGLLKSGGELVLETLVIEGEEGRVLLPENRYAQMRNVWFIPTPATLLVWLKRCGFRNVRVLDASLTTPEEQRSTDWMRFQSLPDFLDPDDSQKTCEGYPAPRRGIFLAERP